MKLRPTGRTLAAALTSLATGILAMSLDAAAAQEVDRSVLPIVPPPAPDFLELDVRDATPPPFFQVTPPEGAPNVLIVLVDDLGFAGTTTFGGPVWTPTFDELAAEGLRFIDFHTTAVCSPTRAALKSGRNHHVNNMGGISRPAPDSPGTPRRFPTPSRPLAEMLRLNGYSTAAFGKWHETAPWEISVSVHHDRWPTRQGFDKFYGFHGRRDEPVGAVHL
jgi:hypothetical protein